jgi:hypothetical protein
MSEYDEAEDPNTPPETLALLAEDEEEWWVRRGVAENLSTQADTLNQLAQDDEGYVRIVDARTTHTPAPTIVLLTGEEDKKI